MNKYDTFYFYDVRWRNEDHQMENSQGFILADSFPQAASKVEASFDCIDNMSIEKVNNNDLFELEDLILFLERKSAIPKEEDAIAGPQIIEALNALREVDTVN